MRKIIKYFAIFAAFVFVLEISSFIFLNVYLRYAKKIKSDEAIVSYREYDPYLLWIPRANISGYDKHSSFKMNNYGFRNSYDIVKEKEPGVFRIIVLGGSMSWGTGASSNDTVWTAALEDILRKNHSGRVEVLNACCSGYTSFQELVYLEFKLLQFSPDMVIVLDGYNDLFMSARYPEDKYGDNVSVYYEAKKKFFNGSLMAQVLGLVANRSHFYALFDRARQKIRYERGRSLSGRLYVHGKGIDNYLENTRTISDVLGPRKIKALFLLQPYMGTSKKSRSPEEEAMFRKNIQSNDVMVTLIGMLKARHEKFALNNNMVCRDLTDIYDDLPSSEAVWYDHVHLNDRGHRILAEKVSKIILKEGFLDKQLQGDH